MAFIRAHQLDIMLFMSGICAILAYMTLITDSLSRERKSILALMGLSAMLLLLFDRYCYLYRGNTGAFSFLMVRLSNGLVFFLSIFIPHLVTQYLKDLFRNEGGLPIIPRSLPSVPRLRRSHPPGTASRSSRRTAIPAAGPAAGTARPPKRRH